ncbi:hypothetical protein EDD22DRAFT_1048310 [Suillus occidentalis]|nr:hypothetical protein EDD22DRAFT_1048310 [Suillus occidentalis]
MSERTIDIEAKHEETLQTHQSLCPHSPGPWASKKHAAVERVLLEKRKKRCLMEVIVVRIPRLSTLELIGCRVLGPLLRSYQLDKASFELARYKQEKRTMLPMSMREETPRPKSNTYDLNTIVSKRSHTLDTQSDCSESQEGKKGDCTDPPDIAPESTWVTTVLQKAFDETFEKELGQAGLMAVSYPSQRDAAPPWPLLQHRDRAGPAHRACQEVSCTR